MKRYLLDTNALLRYILNDVQVQAKRVVKIFQEAENGTSTILIPSVVFFEATYVLTTIYRIRREEVKEQCEKLLLVPYLIIPDRVVIRVGYSTWVKQKALSFTDAVLLHTASAEGLELITFDKKLAREAKRIGLAA